MSDHISGPRALAWPFCDICDVYAFPSPERPEHLVLVMNVAPFASPSALFSDAVTCRFRVRPVTIASVGLAAAFAFGEDELSIDCIFSPPDNRDGGEGRVQEGRCTASTGAAVSFAVNDEQGGEADGLRVFAGTRLDPFFIDLPAFASMVSTRQMAFKEAGTNALAGQNVLTVVVEVDCAALLNNANGSLIGLVGETIVTGKLPIRLEHVGRPEMKNVIMGPKRFDTVNRDLEIRDLYNNEDAFHLSHEYAGAYRARLNANLAFYDGLDGKTDWPLAEGGAHPLTELLLADFLVVDVSKPYAEDSYFEIEQAMLLGRPHTTCGGRPLNDDIMDTLYTLLVNAANGPRVRDGVDQATVRASQTFPYLARPNPNPPSLPVQAGGR